MTNPGPTNIISPEELATQWLRQKFAPTPQQAAVIGAPPEGKYLVVAGAGAGKTETMAARVVWLVANGYVLPEQVLGLTFTRKAASELGQRIRARLETLARSGFLDQLPADDPRHEALRNISPAVSTYDSYAGNIVGEYGLLVPVEPSGRILSDAEKWMITRDLVLERGGTITSDRNMATIIKHIHSLSEEMDNHLATADDVAEETRALSLELEALEDDVEKNFTASAAKILAAQQERLELLKLVKAYRERLLELEVRSFGQQMSIAASLAQDHPEVGESQRQRFRVVMLDEYQDTAHSQRILLRSLFGNGQDDGLSVTAVGDPMQSIYGFRGATASNLQKFVWDFPQHQESAQKLELTTSWRNPQAVLKLANEVSDWSMEARKKPRLVSPLESRPGAAEGEVDIAFFDEEEQEITWVADNLELEWNRYLENKKAADAEGREISPFSAAVLVRKNSQAAPVFEQLKQRGVPVELSANTGLLDIPEVADVYATLRALVDPEDDPALLRLLTGARFNLGARDLQMLARRAQQIKRRSTHGEEGQPQEHVQDPSWETNPAYEDLRGLPETLRDQLLETVYDPTEPTVGMADVLADYSDAQEDMSEEGARRIEELGRELGELRRNSLSKPLPDLITDIETMIGVRTETLTRWYRDSESAIGTSHLDEFAKIVRQFSELNNASVSALVEYLRAAHQEEDGLEPGEIQAKVNTVQILTVHRSKGLEWDIVAVPFANRKNYHDAEASGHRTSRWTQRPETMPSALRGDAAASEEDDSGYPLYDTTGAEESKHFTKQENEFQRKIVAYEAREAERLFYVGITRTERRLFVSGAAWQGTGQSGSDSSVSLALLKNYVEAHPSTMPTTKVHEWSNQGSLPTKTKRTEIGKGKVSVIDGMLYPSEEQIQLREEYRDERRDQGGMATTPWPQPAALVDDPGTKDGIELVRSAVETMEAEEAVEASASPRHTSLMEQQWDEETQLLIRERQQERTTKIEVPLDRRLTATQAVAIKKNEENYARTKRRPIPMKPRPYAKRGTAFHNWVEQHYKQFKVFDEDELPGAADASLEDQYVETLKEKFLKSEWAHREPVSVEGAYLVNIGGTIYEGRVDAIFHDGDDLTTGWHVVDWKTFWEIPTGADLEADEQQLAIYRIACAKMLSQRYGVTIPVENVRATFYYVNREKSHEPTNLPTEEEFVEMMKR